MKYLLKTKNYIIYENRTIKYIKNRNNKKYNWIDKLNKYYESDYIIKK